jgi:hypothetical protein
MPHCVLVDFSFYEGPAFFPDAARRTWVPVFPRTIADDVRRDVTRTQIPLVLAWAITPWKAQGMTLRRAVVNLGKAAQRPGVLFVALSRVRRPDDLLLDDNFPDYRLLMRQRRNEAFRQRQHWEKMQRASFSRTIRRHCRDADRFGVDATWTDEASAMADRLLCVVRALPTTSSDDAVLEGCRAEFPGATACDAAAVWARLQKFPHLFEVAEARGTLNATSLDGDNVAHVQGAAACAAAWCSPRAAWR